MFKKLIITTIITSAITTAANVALKGSEKKMTNKHDAEKEIYKAMPMNQPIGYVQPRSQKLIQIRCANCNGEMQMQAGSRIVCCPYCQSRRIMSIESPSEAYVEVETKKVEEYTKLALERERLELEKQKQETNNRNYQALIIFGIGLFLLFLWLLIGFVFL